MSTETQYTDNDNAHALGGAACTHQQEVQALQGQVKRLKDALRPLLEEHCCDDQSADFDGTTRECNICIPARLALAATPEADQ